MAWTIKHWSAKTGMGAVRSPHFESVPFDASANIDGIEDFAEGESVVVEIEGLHPDARVTSVRPTHQRQPPDTGWPAFERVNVGSFDAMIEDATPDTLQLWIGFCCERCTPDARHVRFDGVTTILGLDDDTELHNLLFRLASPAEIRDHELNVSESARAFCIVTDHGSGQDGPAVFVLARDVVVWGP